VKEIDLIELGPPAVVELADATGEALAASGVVTADRLGGNRWEVGPTTKVGVATIAGVTVRIRPKVEIRRILFLLGYARSPGWRDETVALTEVPDLLPALAGAFAGQAERALDQGLLQGYTQVDDSLTVLRGRLREQDQLRQRFGIAIPLLVRFDDHSTDIAENRLVRAAAETLLRLPDIAPGVRVRLRRLRGLLADVSPVVPGAPLPTWSPSRLNARYHVTLWLAEMILRGNAVDQVAGDIRLGGFLIDMAKAFEDFVTAALTQAFRVHGGWCRPQDRHHLDVAADIVMKPDLVWYLHGKPAAVIDAKYKSEKPAGFPDADLYQMLAYCTALGLGDGHLVYAKGNEKQVTHQIQRALVRVHAHTLDLATEPAVLLDQVAALGGRIAASVAAST
jgi:5-methylcytosine-specific restriction enzyme subunit McrC